MLEFIVLTIVGIAFLIIGLINRTGNISTLHSYHRKRVKEEDKLPMGKLVGLGMIIIALSMIVSAVFLLVTYLTKIGVYSYIAMGVTGAGLVVGITIILYATIKYNKGLF